MALHDDLRAAIDKNLSAETAGVLRARLDSIDALEKRVAELDRLQIAANATEARRVEAATKLAAENASLSAKVQAFEAREAILAGAERNILIATMQRESAENRRNDVMQVVGMVFQNATLKRSILTNAQEPVYTPPTAANNYGSVQTATRTESKTITEEG